MKKNNGVITKDTNYAEVLSYLVGTKDVNDFQLINELSQVVRKYRKNRQTVNRKFMNEIYSVLTNNYHVSCKNIVGNEPKESGCSYSDANDSIYLDYNIFDFIPEEESEEESEEDDMLAGYYNALFYLVHEFTHKMQYTFMNDSLDEYDVTPEMKDVLETFQRIFLFEACIIHGGYSRSKNESSAIRNFYDENHDEFMVERLADSRGYYIAFAVIKRVYADSKEGTLDDIIETLMMGYGGTSDSNSYYPLENFKNIYISSDIYRNYSKKIGDFSCLSHQFEISDDYLYERMCLGLPITKDEYSRVEAIWENSEDAEVNTDVVVKTKKLEYQTRKH